MTTWQPIATAPRDGPPVILGVAGGEYNARSGWWEDGRWVIDNLIDVRETCGVVMKSHRFIVFTVEPTHWQPLPEGPE